MLRDALQCSVVEAQGLVTLAMVCWGPPEISRLWEGAWLIPPAEGANPVVVAVLWEMGSECFLFFLSLGLSLGNREEPEAEAGQGGSAGRDRAVPPAAGEGVQGQGGSGWFSPSFAYFQPLCLVLGVPCSGSTLRVE